MTDASPGYISTDPEQDHRLGYATPVPKKRKLKMRKNHYGELMCPLCPNEGGWQQQDVAKEHVLFWANLRKIHMYRFDKKASRHRDLARNKCWMD